MQARLLWASSELAGSVGFTTTGWIHNDVKAANILYEGLDDKGCPEARYEKKGSLSSAAGACRWDCTS